MGKRIAIIPARGGSKRIPGKNIRLFHGKPIIAYSIELALQSQLFDRVVVSTDAPEIKAIALDFGAEVPFLRSSENANDHASTLAVLEEVLENFRAMGEHYQYGCCIYPIAPLALVSDLSAGLHLLKSSEAASVFPVTAYSYPIWRSLRISDAGTIAPTFPEFMGARSQDLETIYHDAGQWYWFDVNKLSEGLIGTASKVLVLPNSRVQDVDNLEDWRLMELKYAAK
jgi:N-acylneuraminate cytidylyltransferase